nr:hypothetical protein [Gordonia rhizosphera]
MTLTAAVPGLPRRVVFAAAGCPGSRGVLEGADPDCFTALDWFRGDFAGAAAVALADDACGRVTVADVAAARVLWSSLASKGS